MAFWAAFRTLPYPHSPRPSSAKSRALCRARQPTGLFWLDRYSDHARIYVYLLKLKGESKWTNMQFSSESNTAAAAAVDLLLGCTWLGCGDGRTAPHLWLPFQTQYLKVNQTKLFCFNISCNIFFYLFNLNQIWFFWLYSPYYSNLLVLVYVLIMMWKLNLRWWL